MSAAVAASFWRASLPELCQLLVTREAGMLCLYSQFTPSYSSPSVQHFGEIKLELPSWPMQSPVISINIVTAVCSKLGDTSFFKKHVPPTPPHQINFSQTHAFIEALQHALRCARHFDAC